MKRWTNYFNLFLWKPYAVQFSFDLVSWRGISLFKVYPRIKKGYIDVFFSVPRIIGGSVSVGVITLPYYNEAKRIHKEKWIKKQQINAHS